MLETHIALRAEALDETIAAIRGVQLPSGAIPEFPGGVTSPWNHVEAAMALDLGGFHEAAAGAYEWSTRMQRPDGAWSGAYLDDETIEPTLDANFSAYIAFGVWHHFKVTGDAAFLDGMWPMIKAAIGFALELQRADGAISWARGRARRAPALLTSCSCIYMSLRSGLAVAAELGHERADWEVASRRLRDAIEVERGTFERKQRFSMDWYYPVLARALPAPVGQRRLHHRWDEFVVAGLGARCVRDRPWVTAGETAELAIALHLAGMEIEAHLLLEWVQHLRAEDGAYWTGATFPDGTVWPRQKPTWGSAAVVLAADVLAGGATASCF